MTHPPSPFTPADCDLRDFAFMPLDIVRLFSSDFHTTATDAEWRAGVTLWCKAWHQVPAASLPDDDAALARLADFGRDASSWAQVKAKALRGWTKCSDGRLYHRVVAEKALEAWIEKLGQRKSSGAGNAKRWGGEFDAAPIDSAISLAGRMLAVLNPQSRTLQKKVARSVNGNPNGSPVGNPESIPSGSQGTGTGTGTKISNAADAARPEFCNTLKGDHFRSEPLTDKNWLWTDGLVWLSKATGRAEAGLRSQLGKWLKTAKDDATALRRVFEAAQDADFAEPIAWITAALVERAKAAAPFEPADEHEWRKRFRSFKANGERAWPAKWGGTRPGDHPAHPAHVLAEFGFQNGAAA